MDRGHDSYVWALGGTVWTELVSTVIHLEPKFVHFDQICGNKFLVNFYTDTGEEVGYRVTFGHVSKCVVLGCEDPRLYQVWILTFLYLLNYRFCLILCAHLYFLILILKYICLCVYLQPIPYEMMVC